MKLKDNAMNINLILSKSWLNRALIIYAHYFISRNIQLNSSNPNFSMEKAEEFRKLIYNLNSESEDVQHLSNALFAFFKGEKSFYLGQGGTSFRFFIIFISRFYGEWKIEIHPRLMQRPSDGLMHIFNEMKIEYTIIENTWNIKSSGWLNRNSIHFPAQVSSQFLSGYILNSLNLPFKQSIKIESPIVSESYLNMTLDLINKFGIPINILKSNSQIEILINQCVIPEKNLIVKPEIDVSSAFSICVAAVLIGDIQITNWNKDSSQPDKIFLNYFNSMEIDFKESDEFLEVKKQFKWKSLNVNLSNSPDLFPVLSVLCAFADGDSVLNGAAHLKFKESNRILKTNELINAIGIRTQLLPDGLKIYGDSSRLDKIKNINLLQIQEWNKKIIFDTDCDHRMAMAAGILKKLGFNIDILNPEVINKSYPNFWNDLEALK